MHRVPVFVWFIEVEVFLGPTRFHDGVGISSGLGLVNDHRSHGAFLRGDFVFVCPATVISHRFSLEHLLVELGGIFRIGNRRIVDQHQDRFALNIDIFVIVPAVLGRDDAIADKNEIRIVELDFRLQSRR